MFKNSTSSFLNNLYFSKFESMLSDSQYSQKIQRKANTYLTLAGKMRSQVGLNLLALRATRGAMGWEKLKTFLQSEKIEIPEDWWISELLGCAVLNYSLNLDKESLKLLHQLSRHIFFESNHEPSISGTLARSLLQSATLSNDINLAWKISSLFKITGLDIWESQQDFLLNKVYDTKLAKSTREESLTYWKNNFNNFSRKKDLAEWDLSKIDLNTISNFFGHIQTKTESCSIEQSEQTEKVTVIVPVYNPDSNFINTISSLISQTWQNLEILVVNDCSTEGIDVIETAISLDSRIKLINLEENGGAYKARNIGIKKSTGDYITVLDADDVSHSQRIEKQLLPFRDKENLIAVRCLSLRLSSSGFASYFPITSSRMNTSFLMFKKAPVIDSLGFYQETRKASDTEYMERIISYFGDEAVYDLKDHLGLIQLTPGSLSRSDFRPIRWTAAERIHYTQLFRHWHDSSDRNSTHDTLRVNLNGDPHFKTPQKLFKKPISAYFSIGIVGLWGQEEYIKNNSSKLINENLGSSTPIALLNGVNPRTSTVNIEPITTDLFDFNNLGRTEFIAWEHETKIDHLLVSDAEALFMLPQKSESFIKAGKVSVLVDSFIKISENSYSLLKKDTLEKICEDYFGVKPEWKFSSLEIKNIFLEEPLPIIETSLDKRIVESLSQKNKIKATIVSTADTPFSRKDLKLAAKIISKKIGKKVQLSTAPSNIDDISGEIANTDLIIFLDNKESRRYQKQYVEKFLQENKLIIADEPYQMIYGRDKIIGTTKELKDLVASK